MEQIENLTIDRDYEKIFCLPDPQPLPVREPAAPEPFLLVVETSNYRIEIEIG
jgi:hypothetical protein